MKSIHLLGVLLSASTLQAQTVNQATATATPSSGNYVIGQQGADSRMWQKVIRTQDAQGNVTYQTNQAYVELATGLNHLVNGQWVASSEQIEISPDGSSASATNGEHQIFFPGNILNGQLRLILPGGQTLASQPIGLAYFDGSNSVLLAVTTNSTGAILPSGNQVIYTNAFDGLNADLLYTYTKAGFEQDVVLKESPPDPDSLGLNPATTRLQVLTEFFNPPQTSVTATMVPTEAGELEDDTLSFGTMQKASVITLINLGNVIPIDYNDPPAIFIDKNTEPKKYISELETNGAPLSWRVLVDRYVCASDKGNWSIYCEKENDIAVFAFREGFPQLISSQVERLLKAKSIRCSSVAGDSRRFDFEKLVPNWKSILIAEHVPTD